MPSPNDSTLEEEIGQKYKRSERMRKVARILLKNNQKIERGNQSRVAEYFNVSRQRVSQIFEEERRRQEQSYI